MSSQVQTPSEEALAVDSTAAVPPPTSLRVLFARGVLWTGIATIIGKLVSFVAQYLLGRIFVKEEYGLFAMAITAATIGEVFANGGIRTVVISRGLHEYASIARTAQWCAFAITFVAAGIVAISAPFWAYHYYRQPDVLWLLLILAGAILMTSPGTVQRAHLDSELRVKTIAFIDGASALLRHTAVVILAYTGFGVYSFVWPILLMNVFCYAVARIAVGPLPKSKLDWNLAKELLRQGKWVVLTGIGATIIARGDYFVGGGFSAYYPEWVGILGLYFFGYQLTFALFGPFNISMNSIMQPAFARLKANLGRQTHIYFTVVRTIVFLAAPMTICGALVAPMLVHVLWKGKWDATIPVIQLLAITEAVRQLHAISVSVLSARERYRDASILTMVDGFTTMLAALIGCLCGGLLSLTIAIAIQRTVMSLIEAMVVYGMIGGNPFAILFEALKPLVPAVLLGSLAYVLSTTYFRDIDTQHAVMALSTVPFLSAYVLLARIFTPHQYHEALDLVRRLLPARFRGKPTVAAPAVATGTTNG